MYSHFSPQQKLNKDFVEAIAGQWVRLKIETVEDAMKIAEKEHQKYRKTSNTTREVVTKKKQEEVIANEKY